MSRLKVVHISTYRSGGAGRAAYRIHEALLKNGGVDSSFLTMEDFKKNCSKNLACYEEAAKIRKPANFVERQRNRIKFRIKKHLGIEIKSAKEKREKIIEQFRNASPRFTCELASLPFTEYNILSNSLVKEADIIHLHWVAGMLDYTSFFKINKKPLVWTLHDMNPFQGLFHYAEDGLRNRDLTNGLDEKIVLIKQRLIKKGKAKMRVVAPSFWLLKETENSKVFKNIKSVSIPNPIDISFFSQQDKSELKRINEIPENNTVFLFISENIRNLRKGFDLLIDALKQLDNRAFTLIILGAGENSFIPGIDIRNVGPTSDNRKLVDFFSLADAFIIPSREDNLPNVMLESFSCGTPAIGFPVGGIKEHVINFKTGLLADEISSESLAQAIEKFCKYKERFKMDEIRKYAEEKFNNELVAREYIKVYQKILKTRKLNA